MERRLYLDTHILVWLYAGDDHLISPLALKAMEVHPLYYSPMVDLELSYLLEIGRIEVKPEKILSYLTRKLGLLDCHYPFNEVIKKAKEQTWTRDPFDRILVGHCLLEKSFLITKDRLIRKNYKYCIW